MKTEHVIVSVLAFALVYSSWAVRATKKKWPKVMKTTIR